MTQPIPLNLAALAISRAPTAPTIPHREEILNFATGTNRVSPPAPDGHSLRLEGYAQATSVNDARKYLRILEQGNIEALRRALESTVAVGESFLEYERNKK